MARTRDMTHGNPTKLILLFCLPIVAGNLFQQLYSLVDTLVIGRIEGVTALAAVSSAGWLDWTILSLAIGLTEGFSIQVSQCFGAQDMDGLRKTVAQSALLAVSTVVVLEIIAQLILMPVLRLMHAPENTIHLTCLYLRIIFGGMALVMAYNLFSGFLRALGNSRTPLIAMTTAALVNIVLDILFVAEFHWGVAGVAVATLLAQCVSCTICFVALCRVPVMRLRREDFRPDFARMRRLMRLGVPISLQNLVISIGGLVLQSVVNRFGFLFMAGFNAAMRLTGLIELAGIALGSAMGTFSGQNLGAHRLDRVRLGLRRSAQIAVGMSMIVAACMVLFGRPLLALFINDEPAIVEQVLTIGHRYLTVMSTGLFALYLLMVYRSTLQGLGDTFIPMLSGVVELFMRISAVLILPQFIGEWGVYIAEIAAWLGAATLLIWGYYRRMHILQAENTLAPR